MKKLILSSFIAAGFVSVYAQQNVVVYKRDLSKVTIAASQIDSICFEENKAPQASAEQIVKGEITANTTWSADKHWIIDGVLKIKSGVTLTIEPGTVVKGKYGTKATLAILRGAKIDAQGTAMNPIVFTSDQPAGGRTPGDWGGIIICGKAPHNLFDKNNPDALKPEGGIIDTEIAFGGEDAADNSGIMTYCRIEFAGYVFQEGNEINGFTLCAVGNKTRISHIQVSYANDDSFEWFGGTVNCDHIISYGCLDDDFDTDNGFSGLVQYGLILRDPAQSDASNSNAFESDNNSSGDAKSPLTSAVFSNISAFGPMAATSSTLPTGSKHQFGFQIRRNSSISIFNSVFAGFVKGCVFDTEKKPTGTNGTHDNFTAGSAVVNNVIIAGTKATMTEWFEKSATKDVDVAFTTEYLNNAANGNQVIANNSDLKFNVNNFTIGASAAFLPQAGSPLLNAANTNFNHAKLAKADKSATYVGAFGTTDWTAGWANFDPQNADYSLKK